MKDYNLFRIEWDCRRGMLELDKIIMPFFKNEFESLPDVEKQQFLRLLSCSDLQLFSWFFNNQTPADADLAHIVQRIQKTVTTTE